MLRTIEQLVGLEIVGEDGSIGFLEDLFLEPGSWKVRHAVAFAGEWLSGRWILLPIPLLRSVDPARRVLRVAATRERVAAAPAPETDHAVSCLFEKSLYAHYGCGPCGLPDEAVGVEAGRSRLLSAEELKGYRVEARDGDVGRLEDYLVAEEAWDIRYLCVATRRWLPGRKLAAPSAWIRLVNWRHRRIVLRRFRDELRQAPGFAGSGGLSAEYSESLEAYFANAVPGSLSPHYP